VDGLWSVAGLGLLFVVLVGTSFLLEQLGLPLSEHSILNVAEDNPDVLLLLIPLSLLLVGPIEELLYRGVIHTRLNDEFGVSVTIGIAAVIFAMVHFPAYYAGTGGEAVISSLVVIFALGSLLGVLYEYSGNLLVPVVVHGGYNAANFGLKYLEFTGGLPG
jgi:membrane protease YdiL (CAAX protease family)